MAGKVRLADLVNRMQFLEDRIESLKFIEDKKLFDGYTGLQQQFFVEIRSEVQAELNSLKELIECEINPSALQEIMKIIDPNSVRLFVIDKEV